MKRLPVLEKIVDAVLAYKPPKGQKSKWPSRTSHKNQSRPATKTA